MDRHSVKSQLRETDDEYHYRDDKCDIGGHKIRECHVEIKHFVVQRDSRNENRGSILLECLLEVLREENVHTLTVEMGATEVRDLDSLEEYKKENGKSDPTEIFLRKHNFREITPKETYKWGLVFRGTRTV